MTPNLESSLHGLDPLRIISDRPPDQIQDYYLFTGVGLRASRTHLGHHILWSNLARLGRGKVLLFQISNDQKRYVAGHDLKTMRSLTKSFKDQLALYPWDRIHLIDNLRDQGFLKPVRDYINSLIPLHLVSSTMGRNLDLYRASYIGNQLAPILLMSWIHPGWTPVIITAQDQEPFFHIMRDLAFRLGCIKPVVILLNPLKDLMMGGKMSSSNPKTLVPLDHLGLIRKAKTGPGKDHDFCYHLMSMMELIEPQIIRPMIQSYNPQKSKDLKQSLINLIKDQSKTTVKLPSFSSMISHIKPQGQTLKSWIESHLFRT